MGTYAETLLADGELIVRRERQHWLALILDARAAVALWVLGLLLLAAIVTFNIQNVAKDVLSYVVIGAFVLGLLIFLWRFWNWRTEEYLVTNRRLLKVSGIFNKESGDSSLEKINDAILVENLLGRIFDYGDLDILTAADVAVDRYRMLNHAKAFKIEMLNAKHTLEHEMSYVSMPSPPLRVGTSVGDTERSSVQGTRSPSGDSATGQSPSADREGRTADGSGPRVAVTTTASAPTAGSGGTDREPPTADASAEGAAARTADASTGDAGSASADLSAPRPREAATGPEADTTSDVLQALGRLADLRDRGAITAEEFDAKKAEMLGRL